MARAGIVVGKEHKDSTCKVAAVYAAMLAWQARLDALAEGAVRRPGSGKVVVLD